MVMLGGAMAAAQGEELCLQYTLDGALVAGMEFSPQVPPDDPAVQVFDQFISLARRNDTERIQRLFSRLDGSFEYLQQELEQIPDKFSLYEGLQGYNVRGIYRWGQYALLLVEYRHQRGELVMAEPLLCTNLCQMSNIFERPTEAVDQVSEFIYTHRRNLSPRVDCPADTLSEAIYPEVLISRDNPLVAYLDSGALAGIGTEAPLIEQAQIPDNLRGCYRQIQDFGEGLEQSVLEQRAGEVLAQCATTNDAGIMIPVVELSRPPQLSFYGLVAFLGLLQEGDSLTTLGVIEDTRHQVVLVRSDREAFTPRMVVLPLRTVDGQPRFDWNYFATAPGRLLASRFVGQLVNQVLEQAGQ